MGVRGFRALDGSAVVRFSGGSASICWPGYAPGGAVPFFVSPKKGTKERRPQVCDPFAPLRGRPASRRLRGAPRNSLRCCAAAFRQPRRVRARSACILRCTRHPASAVPQAQPQGVLIRAIAALGPASKTGAERSDGPCGVSTPLWPCREAQRLGRAWAAQHAHASCSDLLRLFERGERSERSEFRSTAPDASIAGCPQRSAGTRPVGSPFFCLLFFGDAKKRRCAAGRTSRPAGVCSPDCTSIHSAQPNASLLPRGVGGRGAGCASAHPQARPRTGARLQHVDAGAGLLVAVAGGQHHAFA